MITMFSNTPNRLAVRVSAFVRNHDPIRRWAYDHKLPASVPAWFDLLYDDMITAFVRDVYERGIIDAVRDITEGMYNPTIADVLFDVVKWLHPVWYGEFQHPYVTRSEDEEKNQALLEKFLADREFKPPSLTTLMMELWASFETDAQREHFLISVVNEGRFNGIDMTPQASDDYQAQVSFAAGNHEANLGFLCDDCTGPERREMLDGWRARGLGYLADYYTPLAAERLGLTSSNPDTLDKAA